MQILTQAQLAVDSVFSTIQDAGISFFTGVPDSLLKDLCAYVMDHVEKSRHIIAANEGAAIALAAGHYLATGELSLVYLQNSGLGNATNPLLSLADSEVYAVPMLLLIGWRGEPGRHDEPQHVKQGRVMLRMLEAMEIPHTMLSSDPITAEGQIKAAVSNAIEHQRPCAIIVRAGTFAPYRLKNVPVEEQAMTREDAIGIILDCLDPDSVLISTTGKASREVFELRTARGQRHHRDFLTVGSMGHASQIALGVSLRKPERRVYCLDGDGAVLMHMGSLAIIGTRAGANYKHVVLNNGSHESVGGQPTAGFEVNFCAIASACGYKHVEAASGPEELKEALIRLHHARGPAMLEIRVRNGSRKDLGRPTSTPIANRDQFMDWLQSR